MLDLGLKPRKSDLIAILLTLIATVDHETLKLTAQAFRHYSNSYLRKVQNISSLFDVVKKSEKSSVIREVIYSYGWGGAAERKARQSKPYFIWGADLPSLLFFY